MTDSTSRDASFAPGNAGPAGDLAALSAGRLETHPFLAGLSARHLQTLLASAMPSRFEAGQLIFREGDLANRFYLILRGAVALETFTQARGTLLIQTLGAGEVLGWSWLFAPFKWHFDARAIEPTEAVFFYGTRLREQCEEDHELGYELIKRAAHVMMQRLQATRRRMLVAHGV
jgi:CRP-like cAMP-binding protein